MSNKPLVVAVAALSIAVVYLHCTFKTVDMDPNSRRLLLSKPRKSSTRLFGRLMPNAEGVMRGRTASGYESLVAQVLE